MKKEYKVRKYKEKDFPGIFKAYKEGFPPLVPRTKELYDKSPELVKKTVLLLVSISDMPLVAEIDGEAKGLLTGEFPKSVSKLPKSDLINLFSSITSSIKNPGFILSYLEYAFEGLQYLHHYDRSKPSISLLTSQRDARGGIGTALMDKWIKIVKNRGYDSTVVGTDSRVNWIFYEKYGFERVDEFYLIPNLFFDPKKRVKGFIYKYKI